MHPRLLTALPLLCALTIPAGAAVTPRAAGEALRALPLRFEANAGQWNSRVRYGARNGGFNLLLTGREAVLSAGGGSVTMSLEGANAASAITPEAPFTARANYFIGRRAEWRTGIAQYSRVRYSAVYPGIDVVYYGNGSQLEYDFVLAPAADPNRIRLQFSGADRVSLNDSGDLVIATAGHQMVQHKPVVYQEIDGVRRPVSGRYRLLAGNTAAFEVGAYDRGRSLTIDPVLSYATLLGGAGTDSITAIAVDKAGLVYLTGNVATAVGGNTDISATSTAYLTAPPAKLPGFLAIVDPKKSGDNSLVYFSYVGGTGTDVFKAIAVDDLSNVYLVGSTTSTDFPLAGTNVQSALSGTTYSDGFVIKMQPKFSGLDAVQYGTYLGGSDVDEATAVAVDAAHKIYVTGTTRSSDFPLTTSAYASALYGVQDAFLVKIDPDASTPLLYSTYFGGELTDNAVGITVSSTGLTYLVGNTTSTLLPQAGIQYQPNLQADPTRQSNVDGYLAVFDVSKWGYDSLVYSTYIGGTADDEIRGVALDAAGKVLITGYTLSNDFPTTATAYRTSLSGLADAFLIRFDPFVQRASSQLLYSTYFGGSGSDVAYSVAPDPSGFVWVTGYTLSTDMPLAGGPMQDTNPGGVDVFVAQFDPAKAGAAGLRYSTYAGSTGTHVGYSLAVGRDGSVCVGGVTGPKSVRVTPSSAFQADYAGGTTDGFLLVLK